MRGLWVWQYEGCDMPFELAGLIRLRVKDVRFSKPPSAQQLREAKGGEGALGTKDNPFAPMQVGSPDHALGCMICHIEVPHHRYVQSRRSEIASGLLQAIIVAPVQVPHGGACT